jgi:transposase
MRGADTVTESLFTMRQLEDFVPADHPLRPIRVMVNTALLKMDALFSSMYEADIKGGRPSIAPEKLLRAMLLQVFYSIRSERQLMEQTQYNLLFRWFVGLAMDDAVWVPTVFTKNRERLIEHDAIVELFNLVLEQADQKGLLSGEHFSVDGTLIQAWAGHKSFCPKDGSDDGADSANFKGQGRSNDTHQSSTDADARLYCKGDNASRLRYMGHTLADIFHDEEDVMHGHADSVRFYDEVIAPYKGTLEEWYVANHQLRTYLLCIGVTAWVVLRPKSNLAWRVFGSLPPPPEELAGALGYKKRGIP